MQPEKIPIGKAATPTHTKAQAVRAKSIGPAPSSSESASHTSGGIQKSICVHNKYAIATANHCIPPKKKISFSFNPKDRAYPALEVKSEYSVSWLANFFCRSGRAANSLRMLSRGFMTSGTQGSISSLSFSVSSAIVSGFSGSGILVVSGSPLVIDLAIDQGPGFLSSSGIIPYFANLTASLFLLNVS